METVVFGVCVWCVVHLCPLFCVEEGLKVLYVIVCEAAFSNVRGFCLGLSWCGQGHG